MLCIVTPLNVFRVKRSVIETFLSAPYKTTYVAMPHGVAVELVAHLRGEPISWWLIQRAAGCLGIDASAVWKEKNPESPQGADEKTSVTWRGVPYTLAYAKETLARHFILFRDFFEEYPNEPLPVPHDPAMIGSAIYHSLADPFVEDADLLPILPTLQMLNPVSDAYYLMYNLQGVDVSFVRDCVGCLTQADKDGLMRVYRSGLAKLESAYDFLPLPTGPYAILATLKAGVAYLADEGSVLVEEQPSWLFCALTRDSTQDFSPLPMEGALTSLIEKGFNDNTEYINGELQVMVVRTLLRYLAESDRDNAATDAVMSMLGLKEGDVSSPYQLSIDFSKAESTPTTSEGLRAFRYKNISHQDIERSLGRKDE